MLEGAQKKCHRRVPRQDNDLLTRRAIIDQKTTEQPRDRQSRARGVQRFRTSEVEKWDPSPTGAGEGWQVSHKASGVFEPRG
jgi:hypothetical protein